MEFCKFQGCAVCKDLKYRNIFKYAYRTIYPDIYISPHASYKVTNKEKDSFVLRDLDHVKEGTNGKFYVQDIFTGGYIYLTRENFEIICNSKKDACTIQAHVFKV